MTVEIPNAVLNALERLVEYAWRDELRHFAVLHERYPGAILTSVEKAATDLHGGTNE